ncbi:hypothetical protein BpHYR1_044571 [Brachionus plicatilis]|uniref:Uncharacterized protein n=1 Tax=Brachionus plicatilis TaxID=10195 RepID=A0A3M7R1R8_BRAPC|nr:hypothetical protein BpHYR1_044571 [Brachionus plicatilis]
MWSIRRRLGLLHQVALKQVLGDLITVFYEKLRELIVQTPENKNCSMIINVHLMHFNKCSIYKKWKTEHKWGKFSQLIPKLEF